MAKIAVGPDSQLPSVRPEICAVDWNVAVADTGSLNTLLRESPSTKPRSDLLATAVFSKIGLLRSTIRTLIRRSVRKRRDRRHQPAVAGASAVFRAALCKRELRDSTVAYSISNQSPGIHNICGDVGLARTVFLTWPFSTSVTRNSGFLLPAEQEIEDSLRILWQRHRVSIFPALFLGFSLFSYRARELLICWICFVLLFAVFAVAVVGGIFICYIAEYVIRWTRAPSVVIPVVTAVSAELALSALSDTTSQTPQS